LSGVAAALQITHGLIAALSKEGHWQLTDADAKAYAQAIKNVARHYSLGVTQKALDWYMLGLCTINIEGARVVASYRNRKRPRSTGTPSGPGGATIYKLNPNPNPAGPPPAVPPAAPVQQQPDGGGVEGFTGDGVDAPIGGP